MKDLDKKILNASYKELKKLQKMDIQTQLEGRTFYDAFVELSKNKKQPDSKIHS